MSGILPIYTYDHPILRQKLAAVAQVDDAVVQLALAMHETMVQADGIGLAANQVGRDLQMLVVNIGEDEDGRAVAPLTMINPRIEAETEEEVISEEGCLSLPHLRADVARAEAIEVHFLDAAEKEQVLTAEGLLARVIQHEIDHLRGVYFFDHLSPMRRSLLKRRLLEIKRGEVEADYELYRA